MEIRLIINVPPDLEEALVDCLLAQEAVSGFTSYPVRGHGEHGTMSIEEQVTGRRRRVQFEVQLQIEAADLVLADVGVQVARGLRWWLVPVQASGST